MPQNKSKRPIVKRQQQKRKPKKANNFLHSVGSVAKGVYDVAKVAAPLLGMLPFETSNQYAMTSGGSNFAINSVAAPAANATQTRTLKANIRRSKSGNMYVTHREYIGDIVYFANDLFNMNISQNINPGNGALFPWLSDIAKNFEKFSFKRLHFIYEPQSSTTQQGTVMMAVDWDAKDVDPDSKVEMMSYENAVRSPSWFAASFTAPPHNLSTFKNYFITTGGTSPSGTDIHLYSVGKFLLATISDAAVAASVGELYVDYEVELITPQLEDSCDAVALNAVVGNDYSLSGPLGISTTTYTRFGSLGVQLKLNQLDNASLAGQGILFPIAGEYALNWRISLGTLSGANRRLLFGNILGEGAEDLVILQPTVSGVAANVGAGFLFNDTVGGTFGGVVHLTVKSPGATLWVRGDTNFTPTANTQIYILISSVAGDVWGINGSTIVPTLIMEPRSKRKFTTSIKQVRDRAVVDVKSSSIEVGKVAWQSQPDPEDVTSIEKFGGLYRDYLHSLSSDSINITPLKFLECTKSITNLEKQRLYQLITDKSIIKSISKLNILDNDKLSYGVQLVSMCRSSVKATRKMGEIQSKFKDLDLA